MQNRSNIGVLGLGPIGGLNLNLELNCGEKGLRVSVYNHLGKEF